MSPRTERSRLRLAAKLWTFVLGVALAVAATVEARAPAIHILQPVAGAPVTSHPVLVRGTVEAAPGDVRALLNGRPVFLIQNGEWATLVDLPVGTHTLRAEAIAGGRILSRVETRVAVTGALPNRWPLLLNGVSVGLGIGRNVPMGGAPLRWPFFLDPRTAIAGELDPDGAGQVARLRVGEEYTHEFRAPGFYGPTFRYADEDGRTFVQQGLVVVLDPTWLEAVLQGLWTAYREAAIQGDLEQLVALVETRKRDEFRLFVEMMGFQEIRRLAATAGATLTLVRIGIGGALARTSPPEAELSFVLDPMDGRWRHQHR